MAAQMKRRIKLKHGIETKGVKLRKGQSVTLIRFNEYPWGSYYDPFMTVDVKGYGLVSIPKSTLHKSTLAKVPVNFTLVKREDLSAL